MNKLHVTLPLYPPESDPGDQHPLSSRSSHSHSDEPLPLHAAPGLFHWHIQTFLFLSRHYSFRLSPSWCAGNAALCLQANRLCATSAILKTFKTSQTDMINPQTSMNLQTWWFVEARKDLMPWGIHLMNLQVFTSKFYCKPHDLNCCSIHWE